LNGCNPADAPDDKRGDGGGISNTWVFDSCVTAAGDVDIDGNGGKFNDDDGCDAAINDGGGGGDGSDVSRGDNDGVVSCGVDGGCLTTDADADADADARASSNCISEVLVSVMVLCNPTSIFMLCNISFTIFNFSISPSILSNKSS